MNLFAAVGLSLLFIATTAGGADDSEFDPIQVVRSFPPIENAPFLPAAKVQDEVMADELVLGVVIGDEARAYPINMLTGPSREIINDKLGGRAIAATW